MVSKVFNADLLSREEEIEAVRKVKEDNDQRAFISLLPCFRRDLVSWTIKFPHLLPQFETCAMTAVMRACQKYDPSLGLRFYALGKWYLLDEFRILLRQERPMTVNRKDGRAKGLMINATYSVSSEDDDVVDIFDSPDLKDTQLYTDPDTDEANHFKLVGLIEEFMDTLDARDRHIFEQRCYNPEDEDTELRADTLETLGETYGITRERVRQLEARLRQRLIRHLLRNGIDSVSSVY